MPYPPPAQFLCLLDITYKRFHINTVANQGKVNHRAIFPVCKIPNQPCFFQSADSLQHIFNNLVNTCILKEDTMDITEKRMPGIGKEDLLIPVDLTLQHPGFLKAVQFLADSVGAFAEFSFKVA